MKNIVIIALAVVLGISGCKEKDYVILDDQTIRDYIEIGRAHV